MFHLLEIHKILLKMQTLAKLSAYMWVQAGLVRIYYRESAEITN
jgi:hypothetical protein